MLLQIKGSDFKIVNLDLVNFIGIETELFGANHCIYFDIYNYSAKMCFGDKVDCDLALDYILHQVLESGDKKVLVLEYDDILRYIKENKQTNK